MIIGYLKKNWKKSFFWFLISIFLIKIPPFYVFPLIKNGLLTSHSLSRLIILYIFVKELLLSNNVSFFKKSPVIILFLIYFFFISSSIISTSSVQEFFLSYKDILFPGFYLLVALRYRNYSKQIVKVFILSTLINFLFQIFAYLFPVLFKPIAGFLIYAPFLDLVNINLQRGRIYMEAYDEIIIPFVFFALSNAKNNHQKLLLYSTLVFISLPSFLSNFRSRLIMLAFAYIGSFIFLFNKKFIQSLLILVLLFFTGFFSYRALNYDFQYSFVDRFVLKDKSEDVNTIKVRWDNIVLSERIAEGKPLFGVGLGNYYDYYPQEKKNFNTLITNVKIENQISALNPHNIFAQIVSETGFISLLFYFMMLGYFILSDTKILFGNNLFSKASVISFWSLFLYSLINPSVSLVYNCLFWLLRMLIVLKI